jgi:hypothetical protein
MSAAGLRVHLLSELRKESPVLVINITNEMEPMSSVPEVI